MKFVKVMPLLPLLALLVSASPHTNRRTSRAPPSRRNQEAENQNDHEHLMPPENEEINTMLPTEQEHIPPAVFQFEAAQFDLYEPNDDVRTHLIFTHPDPDDALAIDPRRDSPQGYRARRRAADSAFRHGEILRDAYRLQCRNDEIRHQAMAYLSNWRHDIVGSGLLYNLDGKILYILKNMSNGHARAQFNVGYAPILYTDSRGRLHFVTWYDAAHPGAFNNHTEEGSDPDSEYRRNVAHLL